MDPFPLIIILVDSLEVLTTKVIDRYPKVVIGHKPPSNLGVRLPLSNVNQSICPWPIKSCQMIFLKLLGFIHSLSVPKLVLRRYGPCTGTYIISSPPPPLGLLGVTKWLLIIRLIARLPVSSDILSKLIEEGVKDRKYENYIVNGTTSISHLMYANDILLFSKATQRPSRPLRKS